VKHLDEARSEAYFTPITN